MSSLLRTKGVQIGQDNTATNNFTLYQPGVPDGTLRIGNGNSGSVTDAITINSSGNVGIGTDSPVRSLHVNSDQILAARIESTNADFSRLTFHNANTTTDPYIGSYNNELRFNATGASMVFQDGATEKMRIDSNGYITMPSQPSAQLRFDYGNNLGTSGDNYVNSSWSFDFPFTTWTLSNRGITVVNDGTRDSRITVPVSGRYEINMDIFLNIQSSLRAFAPRLMRNGVTIKSFGWDSFAHISGTTHPHAGYTFIVDANANDYFTVQFTSYDSPSYYLINNNSMLTIKLIG